MYFELHTTVWGPWHLGMFRDVCIPTMLAPGNLPALAERHDCLYRIFTTPQGRALIREFPVFRRLEAVIPVEIVVMANDDRIAALDHMRVWHRAYEEARARNAVLIMVSPDHVWPDGVFGNAARRMDDGGYAGIAVPYVMLVSETSVPEIRRKYTDGSEDGPVAIQPWELMRVAVRNMHPHGIALMDGARHSRPALEKLWPVPGKGFIYRCYVRELFAADTTRVTPTVHFYGAGVDRAGDIYLATDSNEMIMGALHELTKYASIHYPDRPLGELDLAACSVLGANRAPFAWETARQAVYFRLDPDSGERWLGTERKSLLFFWRVIFNREAMFIREAAVANGAETAAHLIGLALTRAGLARAWPKKTPCTAFIPVVSRVTGDPDWRKRFIELARVGNENDLVAALLDHVLEGRVDEAALAESAGAPFRTLGGGRMRAEQRNGRLVVNGEATVVRSVRVGDIGNVVHFVDAPIPGLGSIGGSQAAGAPAASAGAAQP